MLSVVIPVYNEKDCIISLLDEVFKTNKDILEVLVVDDGSTDETAELVKNYPNGYVRLVKLRRNFGQTAALDAGFKAAKGSIIVALDGDGQNDPSDISMLVKRLNEGFDCVCGWRKDRKDPLMKRFISRGANLLRHLIARDVVHDSGCTLKAFKAQAIRSVDLFGEMHRYIPLLLSIRGFKVTEMVVKHHPRIGGKTKYGFGRVLRGFVDLLLIKFWMDYSSKPMHLFGGVGIISFLIGLFGALAMIFLRIFHIISLSNHTYSFLLFLVLMLAGLQLLLFGVLSDILIKSYYKDRKYYEVDDGSD